MATVFYTQIDNDVAKILNTRKSYYASEDRSTGAHTWLLKKMSYVSVTAKDGCGRTAALATPIKGGLARTDGSGKSSGGLYKEAGSRTKSGESTQPRFIPKPHVNSVKIGAEGDYGSILKCEVAFSVYSLSDLDSMQPFFQIGADIGIEYGWNQSGGGSGKPGKLQGKIYNFSYRVNNNGGFDCISYGMSKGINVLGANANAPVNDSTKAVAGKNGDPNIFANNVMNDILVDRATVTSVKKLEYVYPQYDIGAVKYDSDWATSEDRNENIDSATLTDNPEVQCYISLEGIAKRFNSMLKSAGGEYYKNAEISCNSTITKGNLLLDPVLFASSNPTEVIFPGSATYGTKKFLFGADYDSAFSQKGVVDLSKCMFNINWLNEQFKKLGAETIKNQKSSDSSIASFFKILFDTVEKNSGGMFKLVIASDPTDKTGSKLQICERDFVDPDTKVTPYEITAVTQNSICRSVSIQSKLPSEFATVGMVAAQNSNTSVTSQDPSAFVYLNNCKPTNTTPAAPTATNAMVGPTPPSPAPDATQLRAVGTQGVTPTPAPAGTSIEMPTDPKERMKTALQTIGDSGTSVENVTQLQAATRALLATPEAKEFNKTSALPVPIDFSCTLDGIEGIVFGNTITCNYLPTMFKQSNLCFTVTKVEHNISGNDWTTTLSTICRVRP